MIFTPKNLVKTGGSFVFAGDIQAIANPCFNKAIFKEFWRNFTFQSSTLTILENDDFVFSVGGVEKLPLDGSEYSINVTSDGFCVYAENKKDLISGFMTLIDRFTAVDRDDVTVIEIECCQLKESALIKKRMVHFCIFPETEIWELQRFLRFCGALKYTHVVLEFWGMLKYDCLEELAWSHGFTKEQIRPIIREANDLGLEIIPMFNHWGHASAGRIKYGKHVVLDQNPSLQTYFSKDGWCWDISKPKVRELLRNIRKELIELCGDGEYLHIGCDEAYNFDFSEENMKHLSDFINEISDEMNEQGRRVIAWGDMLLYQYKHYNPKSRYTCNAPTPEVEQYFLNRLSKKIVIADWQYRAMEAPVETSDVFVKAGFDCLLCPWDEGKAQIGAAIATVKEKALMGYMHTTWHTLSEGMPYVMWMALGGFEEFEYHNTTTGLVYTATLMRKVFPICGEYGKAGWSKYQIGNRE